MDMPKLIIEMSFWDELYEQLGRRGNDETESGAFLLGKEGTPDITDVLYYDDLEPGCLDSGGVHITNRAFIRLSDYCLDKALVVKADIHTHPGRLTGQSFIDRENPMIKVKGHIGLIVPFFAWPRKCDMNLLGIHEFLGQGFKWKSYKYSDGLLVIKQQSS